MSRKLYCPICHGSLMKGDVNELVDGLFESNNKTMSFDLRKIRELEKTDPDKIKKFRCYNCKRQLRYFVEDSEQ